jgi:hypothetical protein
MVVRFGLGLRAEGRRLPLPIHGNGLWRFAHRNGKKHGLVPKPQDYGPILVDLDWQRVADLLSDSIRRQLLRSASNSTRNLKPFPGIIVVSNAEA